MGFQLLTRNDEPFSKAKLYLMIDRKQEGLHIRQMTHMVEDIFQQRRQSNKRVRPTSISRPFDQIIARFASRASPLEATGRANVAPLATTTAATLELFALLKYERSVNKNAMYRLLILKMI